MSRRTFAWRALSLVAPVALASACSVFADLDGLAGGSLSRVDGGIGEGGGPSLDAATEEASTPDAPCSGALCTAYGRAVMADAPTAYFRFDDASSAQANDVVGSSIVATLRAGARPTAGGSLHFETDGATLTLSGRVVTGAKVPFTIESWVRIDAALPSDAPFAAMDFPGDGAKRTGMWLVMDGATFRTETWAGGNHLFYAASATTVAAATWYHVVAGYSAAEDRDFLYVNGVPAPSAGPVKPGARIEPTGPARFGGMVGSIDDVAVYAAALAPARIAAHFAAH